MPVVGTLTGRCLDQSVFQMVPFLNPVYLLPQATFCLEGMGLVILGGGKALLSCELYRQYFLTYLDGAFFADQHS